MFYNKATVLTEAEKKPKKSFEEEFVMEDDGDKPDEAKVDDEEDADEEDSTEDEDPDSTKDEEAEPDKEDENPEETDENPDEEDPEKDSLDTENPEDDAELPSDGQDDSNLDENDEKISENPLKVRNLYSEYKLLYKGISNTIERLGKFSPSTPIEANLFSYILEALNDLREKLYFYMTELFSTKTYQDNLVIFFSYQASLASTKELVKRLAMLDDEQQNS